MIVYIRIYSSKTDIMNIVITGASRGIGFEITKAFVRDSDHTIVAIARNADSRN
ncbi:MAG: hypothetical protein R2764_08745 [Bacteroidales bacterium]